MPTYFEFKQLKEGFEWKDFLSEEQGYRYTREILHIPRECIACVRCYPSEACLGGLVNKDRHLIRRDWFHRLVSTHSYCRTDYNLMVFF